jgi:hypothetical protein
VHGGWPTGRTLVIWSAGTGSGKCGLAYLAYTCTLVCWNRFWQVGAPLPGEHLYSGLLGPVLAGWGLAYLAYTCTLVCWNRFWQVGGWPTWRTLVLWSAGTDSGKWGLATWSAGTSSGRWGLAYLAYTCTLVCWNRFWQVAPSSMRLVFSSSSLLCSSIWSRQSDPSSTDRFSWLLQDQGHFRIGSYTLLPKFSSYRS